MRREKGRDVSFSMELFGSAINDTWKLFTLGSFLALVLVTLLLTAAPQTLQISSVVAFISNQQQLPFAGVQPPASAPADSSVTANATGESEVVYSTAFILTQPFFNSTAGEDAKHEIPAFATTSNNSSSNTTLADHQPPSTATAASPPAAAPAAAAEEYEMPTNSTAGEDAKYEIPAVATTNNNSSSNTTLADHQPPTNATAASPPAAAPAVEEHEMPTNSSSAGFDEIKASNSSLKAAEPPAVETKKKGKCNIYEGKWVYKPEENPRYRVHQCPFLEEKMSCQRNGRPDSDYEGWSWESNDCQIPLFNGKEMLKKLRGKRMLIAGDSLSRNQWESLACLLYTSVPSRRRVFVSAASSSYKVLKALDYKFTLEFYWAPFLVHFNEKHSNGKKVVMLDELVPESRQWRGADVMVFNSGHWWTHNGKYKAWDTFEYDGAQVEEMQTELAYQRALATWKAWLSKNVDPTKTRVFFRSISPEHKREQWCYNASRPIEDESYKQIYPQSMIDTIEDRIREINGGKGVHVGYLNVTKLSSYRRDAHPSIFRYKDWKVILEKNPEALIEKSDCSHWCLPGLPDTWNRVLYATLFFDNFNTGELINS